ncbi:hypothetical protein ACQHGV_11070 [Sphingomonas pseudosanguinis]|uniref:hypothetical protein n=1 Tax=Sphingomonas pseudosanguinis TaxID=413712 RepID=UPI003F846923
MTSIMVSEGADWGASREAARVLRKKRRRRDFLIFTMLGLVSAPLLIEAANRNLPLSSPVTPWLFGQIVALAILVFGSLVVWRNWRETDEMQRQLAIETWALIGLANFILHPVLTIIGAQLHKTDFEGHSWGIAILIGLTFYAIRRVRS